MAVIATLFILGVLAVILPIIFPTFFFDMIGKFFEWKTRKETPRSWDDL